MFFKARKIGNDTTLVQTYTVWWAACVAERLKTRTPDLEVRYSSLGRCVVSLDKLGHSLHFITLFTQVQAQMVTGDMLLQGIPAMDQRTIHGSSNTPRSAKETGISSVRLGLWLVYAFFHQDKWQCFPESFDFSTNEISHRKTNKQTNNLVPGKLRPPLGQPVRIVHSRVATHNVLAVCFGRGGKGRGKLHDTGHQQRTGCI